MSRPIEYTLSFPAPQTQTVEIRMRVRNVETPTLDVALPVWRPGKYAILNPAGTVQRLSSLDSSGRSLATAKVDKSTWRIQTGGAPEIDIRYSLYANSLGDRTRHVDETHAFISGATVFLYIADRRNDPIQIDIEAPVSWNVASGLKHESGNPRRLFASNYDVLVDSPIEIGQHDTLCFAVDGIPHEIVIWGDVRYDGERLKRDFARIVREEAAIFGAMPYERYVFLVHAAPGIGGGTEHLNSTIIQAPPRAFEDPDSHKKLLGLAAHELFHTWNVKRLRPAALRTLDYSRENYTDLLWFCEGTTSYYDELVVLRAGLDTPDAYLRTLGEAIHQMRCRPGRAVQSVAESSFDAWIKFNHPTPDDINSTVSFYDGGALVSLLLDLELRRRSSGRISLDTVMQHLFKAFPDSGPGFTAHDLLKSINHLSGDSFDDLFAANIRGTADYPLEKSFQFVGIELQRGAVGDEAKAFIGLSLQDQNGATVVRAVLSTGPAYLAGVQAGDEIAALDGRWFNAADLIAHIEGLRKPGDTVELELVRRASCRTIRLDLGATPRARWTLTRTATPTREQKEAYRHWLGHSWAGEGERGSPP